MIFAVRVWCKNPSPGGAIPIFLALDHWPSWFPFCQRFGRQQREKEREREISVPRGLSSFVGWPSNDIYNMGVHWLTQMGPPVQWITFSQVIGHAQHTGIAQKDAGPSLCTFSYYGG